MSAETKIIGTAEKILPIQQITDSFSKREIVVKTGGEYPQLIIVQFVNDQCGVLDGILENENVEISVNIRGREWTSPQGEVKYFNTLQGWRIDKVDAQKPKPKTPPKATAKGVPSADDADDDLPF